MKILNIIFFAGLAISPAIAFSQNLTPTLDRDFDVCQDRPLQPEWIDELPSRDAFKGAVIQMIYRAQSYQRVVEAEECSCETRFPTWEAAVQQFNDNYLSADRNRLRDARNEYRTQAHELRDSAKAICEKANNW